MPAGDHEADSHPQRMGDGHKKPNVTKGGSGPEDERSSVFFAAVQMTRMPMVITDPNQHDNPIIFINHAFADMTGYHPDEIIGRNCRFLQGPATDPTRVTRVGEAVRDHRDVFVEILNYKKDGSPFWNALFISPVPDENGKTKYFFGSQLDVTRRKIAEEGLRQSQKMEAIGQLTGGVAHDFNNLLQVITGNIDRAIEGIEECRGLRNRYASDALAKPEFLNVVVKIEEAILRYLTIALNASERGAKLTQQLLSFARKQRLDPQEFNINEHITSMIDLIPRAVSGNVTFGFDLGPEIRTITADRSQLDISLVNLCINARDAMPDGGRITISTALVTAAAAAATASPDLQPGLSYVRIAVADTGTGIPPELIHRVTEPFFTTKDPGKGTGLGLSMVYGLMRQSGGFLHITSAPGKGTTVGLYFPINGDMEDDDGSSPIGIDKIKGTILVVEDQSEVMDLAISALRNSGYRVIQATSANEAIERFDAEESIDVLFTDIVMPGGMNGLELARIIQGRKPSIKVLVTTGFSTETNSSTQVGVGYPVLQKPYRAPELKTMIREMLEN